MAVFCGAFPVLPGKTQEMRTFAAKCMSHREEFAASLQQGGGTHEPVGSSSGEGPRRVGVTIATISGSGTNLAGLLAHAFT